jgi:hypothetical protein
LWDVEDQLGRREAMQLFDQGLVELARAVVRNNDARSAIKRRIKYRARLVLIEEKSYGVGMSTR